MKSFLTIISISLLLFACREPEPKDPSLPDFEQAGFWILNEGLYGLNNSSLGYYQYNTAQYYPDLFQTINKRQLGDVANDLKRYGSKIYILTSSSSQIEVLSLDGQSIKRIPIVDSNGRGRQPRHICFQGNKAYFSCFDGQIGRLDTTLLMVEAYTPVGRNPEGIAISNGKLYTANSGGLSFPAYDSTLSVVDIHLFKEISRIAVPNNPVTLHALPDGSLLLACRGDYGQEQYSLHRIDTDKDQILKTYPDVRVLNFCISGTRAYCYNYNYTTKEKAYQYLDLNTDQWFTLNLKSDQYPIKTPYAIAHNPYRDEIYVSDAGQFSSRGRIHCFGSDQQVQFSFISEINPNQFIFIP